MDLGDHDLSNLLSVLVAVAHDHLIMMGRSELPDLFVTVPGFEDARKREDAVRDLFLRGILIEPKRADGFILNHPAHPLTRDEIVALQMGAWVANKESNVLGSQQLEPQRQNRQRSPVPVTHVRKSEITVLPLSQAAREAIAQLPTSQAEVVRLRLGCDAEPVTLQAIADRRGVSRQRIDELQVRAMIRLLKGAHPEVVDELAPLLFPRSSHQLEQAREELRQDGKIMAIPDCIDLEGSDAQPQITPLPLEPETVIQTVTGMFNITPEDIVRPNREKRIARVRHIAMYLVRQVCGESYPGAMFHFRRDHATIMHGCQKIEAELKTNAWLRKTINTLLAKLEESVNESGEDKRTAQEEE